MMSVDTACRSRIFRESKGPLVVRELEKEAESANIILSVVVPTFNERENVGQCLKTAAGCLDKTIPGGYELIVVDDESSDGTAEVVMGLQRRLEPVVLVRRRGKRDLSIAAVRGWQVARGQYLGLMDADFQHPPQLLPELFGMLQNGADLAVASRRGKNGSMDKLTLSRKLLSKSGQFITSLVIPEVAYRVSDPMSGYFMMRRSTIEGVELNPLGFRTLLEVLVRGSVCSIDELGYAFDRRKRGASKVSLKVCSDHILHLYRLRRALWNKSWRHKAQIH